MFRWLFALALHALIASWSITSTAQPAVVAATLFQQAVSKMAAGQFSDACPLLEESYRLAAKPGTLFTLANCRDREGKVATASVRYNEYLRTYANMTEEEKPKHAGRVGVAESRVREIDPALPTLNVVWRGELPANLKILVDSVELAAQTLNVPLPFDPGSHEIVVQQPGVPEIKRIVTLEIGHATTFDLDVDVSLVKPPVAEPSIVPPPEKPVAQPSKPAANPQRTAGFVALGVGGTGLAFGGIMGALALFEKRTVDAHCSANVCDATGFAASNRMGAYAPLSTAGLIAGGVLATAGIVLVLTTRSPAKEKPIAIAVRAHGVQGGGLVGVGGTF